MWLIQWSVVNPVSGHGAWTAYRYGEGQGFPISGLFSKDAAIAALRMHPRGASTVIASTAFEPSGEALNFDCTWYNPNCKNDSPSTRSIDAITALSYSSAFFVEYFPFYDPKTQGKHYCKLSRATRTLSYQNFLGGRWPRSSMPPPDAAGIAADGGLFDTNALMSLLKAGARDIVLFDGEYGPPPTSASSRLGRLFGVPYPAAKCTHGETAVPLEEYAVFDSSLYAEAIANLTEGGSGVSILRDVPVLANEALGIAGYALNSLVLVGRLVSEGFKSFAPQVARAVPDEDFTSVKAQLTQPLARHAACLNNQWKVTQIPHVRDHLRSILLPALSAQHRKGRP